MFRISCTEPTRKMYIGLSSMRHTLCPPGAATVPLPLRSGLASLFTGLKRLFIARRLTTVRNGFMPLTDFDLRYTGGDWC